MRYYKLIYNNYLVSVGTGAGGEEITEAEYSNLLSVIHNKPTAESGYGYRLREDLEWELCELPPVSEDDEISAEEALEIIRGGAV